MDDAISHSCPHCENIVLSRPENDPDPRTYLDDRIARLQGDARWEGLEDTHLAGLLEVLRKRPFLDINGEDLSRFTSDGCLFYHFVSTTWEDESHQIDKKKRYLIIIDVTDLVQFWFALSPFDDFALSPFDSSQTASAFSHKVTLPIPCSSYFTILSNADFKSIISSTKIPVEPSLTQARKLYDACVASHPGCSRPASEFAPTRLVRIWNNGGRRLLQLVEMEGRQVTYAALSYCWGGEQLVCTKRQNLHRHRVRINFTDLPKSLQDAVTTTERLGIEYIWIDALCIIQNSQDDKTQEIEHMGYVYKNAAITISAYRAEGAQAGFLHDFEPPSTISNPEWVFKLKYRDSPGQLRTVLVADKRPSPTVDFLSKRAWAYQERMFSSRILEFKSTCAHWSCKSQKHCDKEDCKCNLNQDPWQICIDSVYDLSYQDTRTFMNNWDSIVRKFSERTITYAHDRLPALAGIAEHMGGLSNDRYLAGIWESSIPHGLLWQVILGLETTSSQQLSSEFVAPSWSWASATKPVSHIHIATVHCNEYISRVKYIPVDVGLQPLGSMYGRTVWTHLTLQGFITPVYWDRSVRRIPHTTTIPPRPLAIYIWEDVISYDAEIATVYLLALVSHDSRASVAGLILRKRADQKYSRLGMFKASDPDEYDKDVHDPVSPHELLEGNPVQVTIV